MIYRFTDGETGLEGTKGFAGQPWDPVRSPPPTSPHTLPSSHTGCPLSHLPEALFPHFPQVSIQMSSHQKGFPSMLSSCDVPVNPPHPTDSYSHSALFGFNSPYYHQTHKVSVFVCDLSHHVECELREGRILFRSLLNSERLEMSGTF